MKAPKKVVGKIQVFHGRRLFLEAEKVSPCLWYQCDQILWEDFEDPHRPSATEAGQACIKEVENSLYE